MATHRVKHDTAHRDLQLAYLPSLHHGPHQAIICHDLVQAHVVVEEVGLPCLNNHLHTALHKLTQSGKEGFERSHWLLYNRCSRRHPMLLYKAQMRSLFN